MTLALVDIKLISLLSFNIQKHVDSNVSCNRTNGVSGTYPLSVVSVTSLRGETHSTTHVNLNIQDIMSLFVVSTYLKSDLI